MYVCMYVCILLPQKMAERCIGISIHIHIYVYINIYAYIYTYTYDGRAMYWNIARIGKRIIGDAQVHTSKYGGKLAGKIWREISGGNLAGSLRGKYGGKMSTHATVNDA
jgi:hypothetical protein